MPDHDSQDRKYKGQRQWQVPGYDSEGNLDYDSLLEQLDEWVRLKAGSQGLDLIIVQVRHDLDLVTPLTPLYKNLKHTI